MGVFMCSAHNTPVCTRTYICMYIQSHKPRHPHHGLTARQTHDNAARRKLGSLAFCRKGCFRTLVAVGRISGSFSNMDSGFFGRPLEGGVPPPSPTRDPPGGTSLKLGQKFSDTPRRNPYLGLWPGTPRSPGPAHPPSSPGWRGGLRS